MNEMEENSGFENAETPKEDMGGGGFVASLGDIFLEPNKVFKRIDAGLQWWKAFIVIAVLQVIIGWLNLPIQSQVLSLNERGMSEEQLSKALEQMGKFGLIGLILAPIAVIVIYLICAWIVNVGVNILSARSNYKKVLSLISFTGLITMVEQVISVIIVRARGIETIESAAGGRVSLSLSPLFPDLGGFGAALLESLSVFSIWYYIVLTLGIAAIFKIEIKKSAVPVVILWIISIIFLYLGKLFGGA